MKRTTFTLDLSKYRKLTQALGTMGRTYALLSATTLAAFLLVVAVGYGQTRMNASPASSMKGLAASVSNEFFLDMMGLEVPHLAEQKDAASTFSQKNVFGFMFRMLTDINLNDPKTLLAREIPGLGLDNSYLLRKPNGAEVGEGPVEYAPANTQNGGQPQGPAGQGGVSPAATGSPAPSATPSPAASGAATASPSPAPASHPTTDGKKVVLIYHSHNRESWVPELGLSDKDMNKAQDSKKNITLVGKELADRLEDKGIGAVHYNTDYATAIDQYNWYYSYKYSSKTVKEAFAANPDIQFVFDLHRDDSTKDKSTLTVDGKSYAKVFFIIGQKNPNWEKNEAFATQLQEKLEKKMKGLSRGIWAKSAHDGNAEYNQSLSPNSILIEIGGVFNTLEECKRTAGVLADVISDMYWDATKVNAPAPAGAKTN
ncbi:stage II sporulation protein P [Gorillibacterium sp. sgz5001074]|uniref:stage II sporulation protein P n=1 Tax=Gorillibacterium sp. sgz5001074 TaxID=3446695 RepID=UPI003F67650A